MIEYLIILAVLLFIAVLFYKQANEEIEILQINAERLLELPTLYQDRSPIVISDFSTPNLGNNAEMQKRNHIMQMKINSTTFGNILKTNLRSFNFSTKTAEFLAKESGLAVWFEHHLYKSLLPSPYTSFFYSFNTSLWPDHRGLFKTRAFQTVFMPTQGVAIVSIMLPKMIPYLPTKWNGRPFSSLTIQDTPLLTEIKFVEIRLRKGNLLLLPAHILVDVRSEEEAWTFISEIHHPISYMVPEQVV